MTKVVTAIVAGTGIIPVYGQALLTEDELEAMADQYRNSTVPMHADHDIDQPIEAKVLAADVVDGTEGDRQLRIEFEVSDEAAVEFADRPGMSVSFTKALFGPPEPDSLIWVDPAHFSKAELAVAAQRLRQAGFTPGGGYYIQLSEIPPAVVLFELARQLPIQLGWSVVTTAIINGLGFLVRRGRPTTFRFMFDRTPERLTAEITTSSERAFIEGVRALQELSSDAGTFIREPSRKTWRRAGKRSRNKKARKGSKR